ncbi:MAG: class I SAM-dependent methyltransferase [Candidatus Curtissbacteria bacterium]|nr:class I SAM-dependent methyltransferase [Candidatus Curtissbacteria bacterium]
MNKNFLPYDVYERHRKIGSLIKKDDSVLDVGGELDHLSQFCNPKKLVVANLTPADVVIKKGKLPFKNNSFTTVTAIDVLEHIAKEEREGFMEELTRVAKNRVIISFPVGTSCHKEYESKVQKWLTDRGHDVTYLKEHIKYGLPEKEEVEKLAKDFDHNLNFSGNITVNEFLFKLFMFDPHIRFIRRAVYYLKLLFNLVTNNIFYLILSDSDYSNNVIRAYLIIKK